MSHVLRQSTQVVVRIGPFMDATDAVTPETGITLAAADQAEALKAAGAATADISGNTWAAITGAGGWYDLTLTTTDTNTIGDLTIVVQDTSICLPVFARFQVIEEAAYDTIYAASALPASTTNITAGTITTATNVTTVNGLAANVITATAISADAITAAKVAADVSAEIADAVFDEDMTGHQTQGTFGQAIGDPVADTNTIYKAVVTDAAGATVGVDVVAVKAETALILSDTNAILVDTGTTLQAEVDGIQADTEDIQARLPAALTVDGNIKADTLRVGGTLQTAGDIVGDTNDIQTRLPAALVGGRMDSSVGAMAANVMTAAAAAPDLTTELQSGLSTLDAAGVRAAVGLAAANLDTQLAAIAGFIDTEVALILTRIGVPAGASIAADIDAVPTANEVRDAVFARAFSAAYGSFTFDELVKLTVGVLLGKVSGLPLAPAFRNLADTGNVVVATTDADGNRSAVTLTP